VPRRTKNAPRRSHRQCPKPDSWNLPAGNCRFCGIRIVENGRQNKRKRWCSKQCIRTWKLMNRPALARKAALIRDKLVCQAEGCSIQCNFIWEMQVDHIKPLFEANNDPSYWDLSNLQSLCLRCHAEKTRKDMERWRAIYG
jgi:5-methylcytosine-specific restriction endonuclease McrA